MKRTSNHEKRLAWSTPELRRINAGSAEATNKGTLDDGATTGTSKS